jgi:PAS domain S-box-containing protein
MEAFSMVLEHGEGANIRYGMALILLAIISLVARFDFLAFHLVAEMFSIIVSLLVFATAIGSYRFHRNNYLLILGCAYFWIGTLDLAHALTYKGMGLFGVTSANIATQFWLGARGLEAASLLIAPLFLFRLRPISPLKVMAVFGWVSAAIGAMIVGSVMPVAYVDGEGLTAFKVISEWVIIALLGTALAHMAYRRRLIPQPSYYPLVGALVLIITTEALFTLYSGVHGTINLLGHLTKFLSSWLVLEALVSSTLTRPFEMIARAADSFDGIPDPVLLVNRYGLLVQVNRATQEWMGRDIEKIVGRPLVDALHLDPDDESTHTLVRAIETLSPLRDHEAIDGRRQRAMLLSMAPFYNSNRDAIVVVSLRDITERQAMERALSVAKQRSEMALINSRQGLWDWNIKTGEVFFSPAMETMLGYDVGTWKRHVSAWERLLHPDDLPRVMSDLSRHLDGEIPLYDNTHRLRHKDGHWVWVRDRGQVVERDQMGGAVRAVGTHSDVSMAVARETQLASANAELQSFAYAISHDLKEPLQTISQQLHRLKQSLGETLLEEPTEFLDLAQDGAHRLNVMIDGLLEYARIDTDSLTPTMVDMTTVCRGVIRTLDRTIVECDGQIACGPSLPVVRSDSDILQRIMHNLISNALKYHAEGKPPSVSIDGWSEADTAVIEVSDQGIGINPQESAVIFDIFRRGSGVQDRPGLGIGLAVVKRSLERLGGTISVTSQVGKGSTFRLTLPLPSSPMQVIAHAAALADSEEQQKSHP